MGRVAMASRSASAKLPSGAYYVLTILTILNVINVWHRYLIVSKFYCGIRWFLVQCCQCSEGVYTLAALSII